MSRTPESDYFKEWKPKVPPTFDGVDFDDHKALKAAQDAVIREQWVQSMMARLIRDEMGKCYQKEGINHFEKCQRLRERYLEQMKHAKITGFIGPQFNYVTKEQKEAEKARAAATEQKHREGKRGI